MKIQVPKYVPQAPQPPMQATPAPEEIPETPEEEVTPQMPPPPVDLIEPPMYQPPVYEQPQMPQVPCVNMICCPMLTNAECPMLYNYKMQKQNKCQSPYLSNNPPCCRN